MKILVLNSGSSSIKFKLYEVNEETDYFHALCEGQADRIGIDGATLTMKAADQEHKDKQFIDLPNHSQDSIIERTEQALT